MYRNNRMEKMAEIEKVIFMNMCMVYDHAGRVLALDKVGKAIPERHSLVDMWNLERHSQNR